jgi:hypothetical protein
MISHYTGINISSTTIGRSQMIIQDEFCKYYKESLEGTYDCVDHMILNAYFPLA